MTKKKITRTRKQEIISAYTASRILRMTKEKFLKRLEDGYFPFAVSKLAGDYKFRRKDVEDYFEKSFKVIKK